MMIQPISNSSDYVIVRKSELDRIKSALKTLWNGHSMVSRESSEFEGNVADLRSLGEAVRELKSGAVVDLIRRVDADDFAADPVLLILPPGINDADAVSAMNSAIEQANLATNDGKDDDYWADLAGILQSKGIAIESGIKQLPCIGWDSSFKEDEPVDGDPDWVRVSFSTSEEENADPDSIYDGVLEDGSRVMVMANVKLKAFCHELVVMFPNAEKYGTPSFATEEGASKYVRRSLGLEVAQDFEVVPIDRGDDGASSFKANCIVHRDCIAPHHQYAETMRQKIS